MAKLFDGREQRTRKKRLVGEGKDFRMGEAVDGTRASYGESKGGAGKAADSREKEATRARLQKAFAQREEILRAPEKKKAQIEKNQEVLKSIFRELADREGPDYGAVMDFSQDYVPLDNTLGAAARKAKNQAVARKMIRKRNQR